MEILEVEIDFCRTVQNFEQYLPTIKHVFEEFLLNESKFNDVFKDKEQILLEVSLVSDSEIAKLNSSYRDKNKPTDVLSFPVFSDLRKIDSQDELKGSGPLVSLGSIFIAEGVLSSQAKQYELTECEELTHLICHGFLHICGFDHELSQDEDDLMRKVESELVELIAKRRNN